MHLSRHFVLARETFGEHRLQTAFILGIQTIHRLFQTKVGLGRAEGNGQIIGEREKIHGGGKDSKTGLLPGHVAVCVFIITQQQFTHRST